MDECMWSGSDTPPLYDDEKESRAFIESSAQLNCPLNKKVNDYLFLQCGFIPSILSLSDGSKQPSVGVSLPLAFFGRQFSHKWPYISNERHTLFVCFRAAVFRVMRLASQRSHATCDQDMVLLNLRKDVSNVFCQCNSMVSISKSLEHNSDIESLLQDFDSLILSTGTLSDTLNIHSIRKVNKDEVFHALFHIHYELHIHHLLLITQIIFKCPGVTNYQTKFCIIAVSTIQNFIHFLHQNYEKKVACGKTIDYGIVSCVDDFFTCSCVKEVWVVLLHIIDFVSKKFSLQSFWSLVSAELQSNVNIDETNLQVVESSHILHNYSLEFKISFLCNIAPLYWIDIQGNNKYDEKLTVPRNWQVIQELIQNNLSTTPINETKLKAIIWGCTTLTKHWDFQLNIFCMIWNIIYKEMNSMEKRDPQKLNTYFRTTQSIDSRIELSESYCRNSSSFDINDSTFSLFLHYLYVSCKRLKTVSDTQQLSQVKGRIYSKFHKRSINEMNFNGLEKFTTLFSILSFIFDGKEIPNKMCTLISLLQFNQQLMDTRKLIIDHLFLSLFLCKKQNISAESIVQKLNSLFTNLVTLLYETKKKKDLHSQCWDLICYYLECVEQTLDHNLTISDEGLLICSLYANLLKTINDNLKKKVFNHFKVILSSSYLQKPRFISSDYDLIWKNIYLPLNEIIVTEDNCSDLAELIGSISILTLDKFLIDKGNRFDELVNKHGFSEDFPISFKCSYLSHILTSSNATQRVMNLGKCDHIIKGWINSIIQDLYRSSTILGLTRSLISSSQIFRWSTKSECKSAEHVENILLQFISHLGKKYSTLQNLLEIADFRKMVNMYFSGFIKIAENILFNRNCEKSMLLLVKVAAKFVEHCAKMIYSKTSPSCLLPQILDLFVLPFTSVKNPSASAVVKVVKLYLHNFLNGLVSLDIKNDNFLCRKVKEIIQKYFIDSCSQFLSCSKKNPFLISLNGSCLPTPSKSASIYRLIFLEFVRDKCLCLPQPPDKLVAVINFVSELVQATMSEEESLNTMRLLAMKIVSCILICDAVRGKGEPKNVRSLAMNILRKMLSQTERNQSNDLFKELLLKFVSDNLDNYQSVLFRTLHSMCVLSPMVIKSLLSDIESLVIHQENKRGIGIDGPLRDSLTELRLLANGMTPCNR